ncbi:MAG: DNA mismatch repair endonuclease MutL [Clostridiaceae bacterium]|nr:DNA mismatch repair endonuclease MutL [Clostridiaceae bacterium]
MSKLIKVLNDLTINKIAAGEVVEGPYSVIKELIENAIDAKATNITVEIKEGGKKYIRISDNGAGIYHDDIEVAFMRHATSKIIDLEDLDTISTLGFRGEALASIASVSHVEIVTKPKDQNYGISVNIVGGKILSKKEVGCPDGTTIIVKNLFFNTPARLKFMKSPQAETTKISEMLSRLSLSKPDIVFKYINNNNIMFTTPGNNNLGQTILSILDKDLFKNLIPLNESTNDITIRGFISQPTYVRGNRSYEILFVNNRYIKSKLIYKAIEDAYKEKLPINKFPICILNIEICPRHIDVNVHPAKTEVKFHNDTDIYNLIYNAVINKLSEKTTLSKLTFENKQFNNKSSNDVDNTRKSEDYLDTSFNENKSTYTTYNNNKPIETQISLKGVHNTNEFREIKDMNIESAVTEKNFDDSHQEITQKNFLDNLLYNYRVVGQLFNTYIILEKNLSMYLIDQHAAHEKLVFNQMLQEFNNGSIVTQSLLEPKILELAHEDFLVVTQHIDRFQKLGFKMECFGHNTIIIREVPLIMGVPRDYSFLIELLDQLKSENYSDTYFNETIIRKSCREAIKANDRLNISEITKLIDDLSSLEPPLTCPHGRPIILSLSKYEIEKSFKRIQ